MARLTEADAERLARRLAASLSTRPPEEAGDLRQKDFADVRVRDAAVDASRTDVLGRALTLDLASYLNRPVRCSVGKARPVASASWRFEAVGGGGSLWIDLDVGLASAFADAMIGGDGTGTVGHGKKVRALVERVALRMLRTIAEAAEVEPPVSARLASSQDPQAQPLAGGHCAVATDQYAWTFGILPSTALESVAAAHALPAAPAPETAAAPIDVPFIAPFVLASATAAAPEAVLNAAIRSACAHLQNRLHADVAPIEPLVALRAGADDADITDELPSAGLRLAVTAGGNGALVATIDREAVAGLAGAAIARTLPAPEHPGSVVLSAAEAAMRDLLDSLATGLPGIARESRRTVRLLDEPLPAHAPHHAADVRIAVGGRIGTLRLLVPSWMLQPEGGSGSTPDDRSR
jgi:hypothetical protein